MIQTRDPMSSQRSQACLAFSRGARLVGGYPVVRETKMDGHTDIRITVIGSSRVTSADETDKKTTTCSETMLSCSRRGERREIINELAANSLPPVQFENGCKNDDDK